MRIGYLPRGPAYLAADAYQEFAIYACQIGHRLGCAFWRIDPDRPHGNCRPRR